MSQNTLVAEIHNEFDTAADSIIMEAQQIFKEDEIADNLKRIGFISISRVKDKEYKLRCKRIKETVEYYQNKYPFNKFVTIDIAEKICKKYNLICGSIEQFIGELPDKNISEILSFKLSDEDRPETDNRTWFSSSVWGDNIFGKLFLSEGKWCEEKEAESGKNKVTLRICAPSSQFNKEKYNIIDGYLLVNDPIVLQPVKGGYLIVSKWGLEGEDETLVNEKMN